MSFKDSILKYTSATANSVQTANVESAEIAVQAADNYISYNNTSRYKRYSQYSDNNYSLVDKNKNINQIYKYKGKKVNKNGKKKNFNRR